MSTKPETTFGFAHYKREGGAAHPDDCESASGKGLTKKQYLRQAILYMRDTGDLYATFARDKLIPPARNRITIKEE